MSVPSHDEIRRGAAEITERLADLRRDPGEWEGARFWTHGPWIEWERLVPDPRAVRLGEPDAVEHAIVFLEADPWCHRSGYTKESLLRALRRADMRPDQRSRLDAIVLGLVRRGGREFVAALRMVSGGRSSHLKAALRDVVLDPDDAVATRALRMLLAVRRPRLDADGLERARQLLRTRSRRTLSDSEVRRTVEMIHGPAPTWRTDDTTM